MIFKRLLLICFKFCSMSFTDTADQYIPWKKWVRYTFRNNYLCSAALCLNYIFTIRRLRVISLPDSLLGSSPHLQAGICWKEATTTSQCFSILLHFTLPAAQSAKRYKPPPESPWEKHRSHTQTRRIRNSRIKATTPRSGPARAWEYSSLLL